MTRRLPTAAACTAMTAALLLLTTACAPADETAEPTPAVTATTEAAAPEASATPTPSVTADAADPTCETIISATTVADLQSLGWVAREDPFMIGDVAVDGGLMCTWGDPTVASDNVQVYGWAPMSSSDRASAQSLLASTGWITNGSDMTLADPPGNGSQPTYRFGDGSVTYSNTTLGLVLIEWPPAG